MGAFTRPMLASFVPRLVLDLDATIVICHSDKESATPTSARDRSTGRTAGDTIPPNARFPAGAMTASTAVQAAHNLD
jgi:hypothetical protein